MKFPAASVASVALEGQMLSIIFRLQIQELPVTCSRGCAVRFSYDFHLENIQRKQRLNIYELLNLIVMFCGN